MSATIELTPPHTASSTVEINAHAGERLYPRSLDERDGFELSGPSDFEARFVEDPLDYGPAEVLQRARAVEEAEDSPVSSGPFGV